MTTRLRITLLFLLLLLLLTSLAAVQPARVPAAHFATITRAFEVNGLDETLEAPQLVGSRSWCCLSREEKLPLLMPPYCVSLRRQLLKRLWRRHC